MNYTVAIREKGKRQTFKYIGVDGNVYDKPSLSKRLTKDEADLAVRLLTEGANKVGRPIDCRVVVL